MNKEGFSVPMPPHSKELLGEGPSFQDTLCTMLKQAHGFEDLGPSELAFFAQHMKAYHVPAGEALVREGERNSYLGVLVEGRIAVYKEDSDDKVKLLNIIPQGKIIGEISVIDNLPYSASLIAETDVTILTMSRESFYQCINDNPAFGVRLLIDVSRLLCARLRNASNRLADYMDF
jgi:CRP/FNR family transcriptional regulator, cyclic AMP receptor protein